MQDVTHNEEVVRRAFAAFNAGDADALTLAVDPEIVFVPLLTATSRPYVGRAGIRRYVADAFTWARGRVELDEVQCLGDIVLIRGRIIARRDAREVEVPATYVARLRDGLISNLVTLAEPDDAVRQKLGVAPAAAAAELRLELEAVPTNVAVARRAAKVYATALGCSEASAVEVATSEAATNVVLHAYLDEPGGPMVVSGHVGDGALVVSVSDEGRGLLPRPDSPGLGLGLGIMNTLASEVSFLGPPQRARGTEVRLRFAL